MKNLTFILIAIVVFTSCKTKQTPEQKLINAAKEVQHKLNLEYADKEKSPLTDTDFKKFRSLDFYPVTAKYIIKARFVRNENPVPFELATTTARKPLYQKYGTLFFELDGVKCELPVYQNLESLQPGAKYKNHIFMPFTDLTTGGESYGGGRYIDLELPFASEVLLDFNRAYNPYCAYNHNYSCAIPPEENDLPVAIKAGVKAYVHGSDEH